MAGARAGEGQLHLRVRGLRRGGQHRIGAEVASGGEENLQTDAGSALIRVYNDAVDERLGHLARKATVCLPPLLDGAAQAFHASNALLECFVCILQFLSLLFERGGVSLDGLVDSGNCLRDPVTELPVVVVPYQAIRAYLPPGTRCEQLSTLPRGFRLICVRTALFFRL